MSIDRGDRVISQMFRSLCCATRVAKVAADGDADAIAAQKSPQKSIILLASENVFHRGLLGKLIASLEDRRMVSAEMRILKPSQEAVNKSKLLKSIQEMVMVSEWRGSSIDTIGDLLKSFRQQFALQNQDIMFIETTPSEHKLWFEPPVTSNGVENNEQVVEELMAPSQPEEDVNVDPEIEKISSEGPFPSVESVSTAPAEQEIETEPKENSALEVIEPENIEK